MIYRVIKDIKLLFLSSKMWVGLMIGLCGFILQLNSICNESFSTELNANVFEIYILAMSNSWYITISVIGLVFMLSDIPYISPFELNVAYRTKRINRIIEKNLYNIISTAIYFFVQLALVTIISLPICNFGNNWSSYSFPIKNDIKINFDPISASLIALLLIFLYAIMIISVLYFLSLVFKKSIAIILVFSFQAIQHFAMTRIHNYNLFCFFRNSILNYYDHFDSRVISNICFEMGIAFIAFFGSIIIRYNISYDIKIGDH